MDFEVQRTHDMETYLSEDRYEQPKEIFKVLAGLMEFSGDNTGRSLIYDVGCATGEFLHYLKNRFPGPRYLGLDVLPALITKAKERVPDVQFVVGSLLDRSVLPPSLADVTFMLGVHAIFDDFETWISNLLYWTRPGGRIFVFGPFNPHPVDVWVKYRLADDPNPSHREPGWNIFSQASISRFLDTKLGKGKHSFTPFEMPIDIKPHPTDVVRTWTFFDSSGRRLVTNGLSIISNQQILQIST
jgi:SAM-dependent methyltransferase